MYRRVQCNSTNIFFIICTYFKNYEFTILPSTFIVILDIEAFDQGIIGHISRCPNN